MKKYCTALFVFICSATLPLAAMALSPVCKRHFGAGLPNAIANRQIEEVATLLSQSMQKEERKALLSDVLMLTLSGQSTSCAKTPHSAELFQILVKSGADVNARVQNYGAETTFLMRAVQDGDTQMTRMALAAGARVNENVGMKTALSQAVERRHLEMATLLLHSGADPSTALTQAVQSRHLEMVELLLSSGADPGKEGHYRNMVLLAAARSPGPANAVLKLLIRHGLRNAHPRASAIHEFAVNYAGADEDAQECLKLLLILHGDLDVEVNLTNALIASIQGSSTSTAVLEALLGRGATADWRAVLALANRTEGKNWRISRAQILELLLRYGLDPDQRTPSGRRILEVLEQIRNTGANYN